MPAKKTATKNNEWFNKFVFFMDVLFKKYKENTKHWLVFPQ